MWSVQIKHRSLRNDLGRVDCPLANVIVLLNVIDTHRLAYTGHLIEFAHIFRQVWIILDALQIDLEVTVVHRIKPDQGREQPPISLGDFLAREIPLILQPGIELIEGFE